ncbi:MAG: GNAT family N-acetyltransferase [Flavobacteriaceae bacterium]
MSPYTVEIRKPTISEYQSLRASTGWGSIEDASVGKALKKDLFSVCIVHQKEVVGMGRVIGDGAIYFYIQDVIVLPEHKGKGMGSLIMEQIERFLLENAKANAFIGLMAATGVKDFYKRFGYLERPPQGPGMYKVVQKS